jgi:hypothetical protein
MGKWRELLAAAIFFTIVALIPTLGYLVLEGLVATP